MKPFFSAFLAAVTATAKSRVSMQMEILALRHQLAVLQRTPRRPRLRPSAYAGRPGIVTALAAGTTHFMV